MTLKSSTVNENWEETRENFGVIIYYDFRRGISQQQYIDQLSSTYDNEAASKTLLYLTDLLNSNMADVRS